MSEKISLDIDTYPLMKKLDDVEDKAEDITETIQQIEEETSEAFDMVMNMARTAWIAVSNIVRAAGGTISTVFRLAIQTAISSAQILKPLLIAQATLGPMGWFQSAIGFTNIMLAMIAVTSAQADHSKIITQMRAAQYALMSISNLVSDLGFL